MTAQAAPITIVGGGIGGLCTAIALGQKGFSVRLLEQAAQIAPIGYGIQLGPNVSPLFAGLGIEAEISSVAGYPGNLLMLSAYDGEELARVPLGSEFRQWFEGRYVTLHRADLHRVLLERVGRLPNVELIGGTTVVGFNQDRDRVQLTCENGRVLEAVALIAADGLKSRIRAQLCPGDDLCFNGYFAHRTVAAADRLPAGSIQDDVVLWVGSGFHLICYGLRNRTQLNIVLVLHEALRPATGDVAAYKNELRTRLQDCCAQMLTVFDVMDLGQSWPIADREPVRKWGSGRMTLLGDAAHATFQSLAQGAGMAIEDAVCLSSLLSRGEGDYEAAFRQFCKLRLVRTARVQLESRALWRMYHTDGIPAEVRREQYQRMRPRDFYSCLDWLWHPIGVAARTAENGQERRIST